MYDILSAGRYECQKKKTDVAEYPVSKVQNVAGLSVFCSAACSCRVKALLLTQCDKRIPTAMFEANGATH
jgi:hypothetical protein